MVIISLRSMRTSGTVIEYSQFFTAGSYGLFWMPVPQPQILLPEVNLVCIVSFVIVRYCIV